MKKTAGIISVIFSAVFLFSACTGGILSDETTESSGEGSLSTVDESSASSSESISSAINSGDMFSDRDSDTSYASTVVNITLSGDTASASSTAVDISEGIITLSQEATYIFSGSLSEGMIYVNADETAKIQIVFDGVSIKNSTSASLYILSCDKVFVTLAEDSENTLENTGTFVAFDDNNIDGAVFSKQDLTFNGNGSLTVSSPDAHGVVCKDDLVFTGGTYVINSASHAIDANDSVRVKNASLTLSSGKDGIHCENDENTEKGFVYIESGTFDISAEGDGISAGLTCDISGGTFDIVTGGGSVNAEQSVSSDWGGFMGGRQNDMPGGGKDGAAVPPGMGGEDMMSDRYAPTGDIGGMYEELSMPDASSVDTADDSTSIKGIKAAGNISISGGNFTLDCADDAVHSNAGISISGGSFVISTGDDGIHAEETLTVSDGDITINESYEGLEALHIVYSGGDTTLKANDDGLNAAGGMDMSGTGGFRGGDMFGGGMSQGNGSIVISGGSLSIFASGDGIDANGTIEITGGHITVEGPTQGDTATLDYDRSAVISGGTFIGSGASGMAQSFSDSSQGVIAVTVGSQSAGTLIKLTSADGETVVEHTPSLPFSIVIISSPDVLKGENYFLSVGEAEGSFNAS